MKIKSTIGALAAISVFATVSTNAAVLLTNPITGTNPNTSNPFTTGQILLPGVTSTGIGRGAGIGGTSANDRYNAIGFNNATAAGTITGDAYFTISLGPTSGNSINFTNFVFTSQASGSGPTGAFVRSSVDSFAANLGTVTTSGGTVSLSAAAFQGITTTTEFRVYGFGASASGGTFSINDFTFNGDVVPEPSAAFLGSLGALALLRRRR